MKKSEIAGLIATALMFSGLSTETGKLRENLFMYAACFSALTAGLVKLESY